MKGQMEILGLIVIVILLFIGMFLLVTLGVQKPQKFTADYNQKLASGLVTAIPAVEISCPDNGPKIKVSEYIRACANPSGFIGCVGSHEETCSSLNAAIAKMMENSLGTWKYDYAFIMTVPAVNITNSPENFCKGKGRVFAEQALPLSASGNPALIRLTMCS
jgi:hypothetical protein